ncbi:Copper amine oxidase N-terminal domain-containing protein [Thermosyntropha lipolytica DSM 11003]|uniref:Copper amine oxidase N-terminal domain-containing protein n=1 Tax=Thermosyntropha lipolytica DSM 11003 TaxID=1123382 RepID=A0A1M5RBB9_9FIRM|nr:stalk domain-containing protein [Thermosyntropha lipolytica]SHH23647.1 Copper amine oxidase N-terminal domain-containing protein [Thermosyntropha lipolytica DSM 11003]
MLKKIKGKNFLVLILILVLGLSTISIDNAAAQNEKVGTHDSLVIFKIGDHFYYVQDLKTNNITKARMDVTPRILNSRTFVPVRFLGNALGVNDDNIKWDNRSRVATLQGKNKIELMIGNKTMRINGNPVNMDVAPVIVAKRTLLPARYVAEGLGFKVEWDNKRQYVIVYPEGKTKPDMGKMIKEIEGGYIDLSKGLTDEAIREFQRQVDAITSGNPFVSKYPSKWGDSPYHEIKDKALMPFVEILRQRHPNAMISLDLIKWYDTGTHRGIYYWYFIVPTKDPNVYEVWRAHNFGWTTDDNDITKDVIFIDDYKDGYIRNGKYE